MLLFPESGPKKNFRVNGFTKTVTTLKESCKGLGSVSFKINNQHTHTLHLRSIGPNVQWHMAYFAGGLEGAKRWGRWERSQE
jgi:hypothetical protein